MRNKRMSVRRTLTWMLALVLVLTSVPATAFAAEGQSEPSAISDAVENEKQETPAYTDGGGKSDG